MNLGPVDFSSKELFALIVTTSFAAGLNVYAMVATLGLLSRAEVIAIPSSLEVVENWWVIGASAALFLVEFVADKIPAFDLLWNALQTFVRVPVAALLAYQATSQLPPQLQILSAILGGLIAFLTHGGKMAARAAVTPSPEPLSNIGLSVGEDIAAVSLTWFATKHPWISAAIVAVFMIFLIVFVRVVLRALRSVFQGARREFHHANVDS